MDRKIVTIIAVFGALSGCSILEIEPRASATPEAIDMSGYFEQRLTEGRRHLAANRPTRAIEAFRQASYDSRYSAEALNGMGVAYSMLGRNDVAERLFVRAIEADPLDMRFARNLERLHREKASTSLASTDAPMPMTSTGQEVENKSENADQAADSFAIVSTGGRLKPFGSEFFIRTGPQVTENLITTKPNKADDRKTSALFDRAFFDDRPTAGAIVTLAGKELSKLGSSSITHLETRPQGALVRVALDRPDQPATTDYPIRVNFGKQTKSDKPASRILANDRRPTMIFKLRNSDDKKTLVSSPSAVRKSSTTYPIRVKL